MKHACLTILFLATILTLQTVETRRKRTFAEESELGNTSSFSVSRGMPWMSGIAKSRIASRLARTLGMDKKTERNVYG